MSVARLVILFSGRGTNFDNLALKLHGKHVAGLGISMVAAFCDKKGAGGFEVAKKHGIEAVLLEAAPYDGRQAYDDALSERIKAYSPDLIVMAGFMRILSDSFVRQFKAINVHPSLLPLFKGAHGIKDSFNSGMKVGGVTVHWVSEELDSGKIIAQKCVPISEDDTLEGYEAKVHEVEYELYPEAVIKALKELV